MEDYLEERVTITLTEYNELVRDSNVLGALYEAGVDNWGGYSEAMQSLEEEE